VVAVAGAARRLRGAAPPAACAYRDRSDWPGDRRQASPAAAGRAAGDQSPAGRASGGEMHAFFFFFFWAGSECGELSPADGWKKEKQRTHPRTPMTHTPATNLTILSQNINSFLSIYSTTKNIACFIHRS
jgi:hypothetical protein